MSFVKNLWYIAAFSKEISEETLLSRRIIDQPIVMFRESEGRVRAMFDRCPHRFVPLSRGSLKDGIIQCSYHGLQFNGEGRCVHNPHGNGTIPKAACVPAYPAVEQDGFVWLWMGDSEKADPTLIPRFAWMDTSRYAVMQGYMWTACNYQLLSDNIMDLSHIEFLHPGLLGSEAIKHAKTEVIQDGCTVHSNRLTSAEILPPMLDGLFESDGQPVDRWLDVRWDAPGYLVVNVGVTPTGGSRDGAREIPTYHLMTPETLTTTHYFWAVSRDFKKEDEVFANGMYEGLKFVFEKQDKPTLEAQQAAIGEDDLMSLHPVMLAGDAGAVRARRVLEKLLDAERKAAVLEPVR